jgi:hypothetical protein
MVNQHRRSSPTKLTSRIVCGPGFGPFQTGSPKNRFALRTDSNNERPLVTQYYFQWNFDDCLAHRLVDLAHLRIDTKTSEANKAGVLLRFTNGKLRQFVNLSWPPLLPFAALRNNEGDPVRSPQLLRNPCG